MVLIVGEKTYPVSSASCYINFGDIESVALLTINIDSTDPDDMIDLAADLRMRVNIIPGEEGEPAQVVIDSETAESIPVYLQMEDESQISFNNYIPDNISQAFREDGGEILLLLKRDYTEEEA